MPTLFGLHRLKLAALLLAANAALLLHLGAGDLKPMSDWVWLDILGEGGSALLCLVWLGLVLKSRPAGRVTNFLAIGLGLVFLSWWVDALDEFILLPDAISWDHWLESAPMPLGLLLLTLGIYHWHREQLAISAQMEKRERLFREHLLFDKLTPLNTADYLRRQLQQSLAEARVSPGQSTLRHCHRESEEIYHVTQGEGWMTLGEARFPIAPGDTVLIPPGTAHQLEANLLGPLCLLCCCSPAYRHEDTFLL